MRRSVHQRRLCIRAEVRCGWVRVRPGLLQRLLQRDDLRHLRVHDELRGQSVRGRRRLRRYLHRGSVRYWAVLQRGHMLLRSKLVPRVLFRKHLRPRHRRSGLRAGRRRVHDLSARNLRKRLRRLHA